MLSCLSPPSLSNISFLKAASSFTSSSDVVPIADGKSSIVIIGTPLATAVLYFKWDCTCLLGKWASPQIKPLIPFAGYSLSMKPNFFKSMLKVGLKLLVLPVNTNVLVFYSALASFNSSLIFCASNKALLFHLRGLPILTSYPWTNLICRLNQCLENILLQQILQSYMHFLSAFIHLLL